MLTIPNYVIICFRDEKHGRRLVSLHQFARMMSTQADQPTSQTGLPIDPKRAPKLCELEPFLSANELLVTPIVVLIIDPLIKVSLKSLCLFRDGLTGF